MNSIEYQFPLTIGVADGTVIETDAQYFDAWHIC